MDDKNNFFEGNDPLKIAEKYQTPLYIYNERILRKRCRMMKELTDYPRFQVDFSAKANSSLALLQIIRSEGLKADAVSMGEIYLEQLAGFPPEDIFFVCNNVSAEEMEYAVSRGVLVSADSLEQLEQYGKLNPGGKVAVRLNPGVGDGHSQKVVTGGSRTKFGIPLEQIPQVKSILEKYQLSLEGVNQHIGSGYLQADKFLKSMDRLLEAAMRFEDLEFIDFGGGLGIPYHKLEGEKPLNLEGLGREMTVRMKRFSRRYGKELIYRIEPGRFICGEAGLLLGRIQGLKENGGTHYMGCDIGFNVLQRPVLYGSHHDMEIYPAKGGDIQGQQRVTVVGNVCESGDILAEDRLLPLAQAGNVLAVLDVGAYGFSMCSSYNSRPRPAELLIRENGEVAVIRERETLEDLRRKEIMLSDL